MLKTKKIAVILAALIMVLSFAACGAKKAAEPAAKPEKFPTFEGTSFSGEKMDNSMFKKNKVTVLNFWFNGCSACVNEVPELEKLNKELKKIGAELVGVNVDAHEGKEQLNEAKSILKKQGGTYRNMYLNGGKDMQKYVDDIYGFPYTAFVGSDGKTIGEPVLGSFDDERIKEVVEMIKKEIAKQGSTDENASEKASAEKESVTNEKR